MNRQNKGFLGTHQHHTSRTKFSTATTTYYTLIEEKSAFDLYTKMLLGVLTKVTHDNIFVRFVYPCWFISVSQSEYKFYQYPKFKAQKHTGKTCHSLEHSPSEAHNAKCRNTSIFKMAFFYATQIFPAFYNLSQPSGNQQRSYKVSSTTDTLQEFSQEKPE